MEMSVLIQLESDIEKIVTPEAIAAYRRDGVVCLRGLFTPWVERMREAVQSVIRKPESVNHNYTKPGEGNFFFAMNMWDYNADFRTYAFQSPAAEAAGRCSLYAGDVTAHVAGS